MNRSRQQITEDILETVMQSGEIGITITPLLRHSNLPFGRASGFIQKLTQSNLINEISVKGKKVFIITERGKMFLEEYRKWNTISQSFGLDL